MAKYSPFLWISFATLGFVARAGDETSQARPALRKEFHQQEQYPFAFTPVAYLENEGPAPMRFVAPSHQITRRDAPAPPAATPSPTPLPVKAEIAPAAENAGQKPGASPSAAVSPAPSPSPVAAALPSPEYPPPQGGPTPISASQVDFEQMPDEVLDFFRNPYNSVPNGRRLFDPIFEPAVMHKAPKSRATYKQE